MPDSHPKPQVLFFAGTDTDVGKTYVCSLVAGAIAKTGRVRVYKPVGSGCERVGDELVCRDAQLLWEAAGRSGSLSDVCPQRFEAPLAPPEAARAEGKHVDPDLLRTGSRGWENDCDVFLVEGAGGLFSPLAEDVLNVDLVEAYQPCRLVIVANDRLGVIHQSVAVCEAARNRGVIPHGVILCQTQRDADRSVAGNRVQVERYCGVPVLGRIGFGDLEPDSDLLKRLLE